MAPRISVLQDDPRGEGTRRLLDEFSAEIARRYIDLGEDESDSFNVGDTLVPRSAFVIALYDGQPVGCGALCPIDQELVEFRRIFVIDPVRRLGIGKRILAELEKLAAEFGYRFIRLETGNRQHEAIALYERYGFYRIAPFGRYAKDPISICFEKGVNEQVSGS